MTYPNQKTVIVHREKAEKDFLGIKNENWTAACRDLGVYGFALYLYFAANANNYKFDVSPVAIRNAIGMPKSTYYDNFKKLVSKGYLINTHGSTYEFYEVPQRALFVDKNEKPLVLDFKNSTADNKDSTRIAQNSPSDNREINNIYNTNKIINSEDNRQDGKMMGFKF